MMHIAKDVLSFIGLGSLSFLNLWICFFYKISNILIHCFFRSFFFPTLLPLLRRQRHKWYTSSVTAHTSLSLCSIYFLFSIYLLSGLDWEEHGWQLPLFLAELFRRVVSLPQTDEEKQGRFNPWAWATCRTKHRGCSLQKDSAPRPPAPTATLLRGHSFGWRVTVRRPQTANKSTER